MDLVADHPYGKSPDFKKRDYKQKDNCANINMKDNPSSSIEHNVT